MKITRIKEKNSLHTFKDSTDFQAARGDSSARQNHYGKDTWRTRL